MEEIDYSSDCAICLNSIIMKKNYFFINKTKYEDIPKNDRYDRLHRGLSAYPIANSKYNISQLECNHEFHTKCLYKWIHKSFTCPLCRNPIYVIIPK